MDKKLKELIFDFVYDNDSHTPLGDNEDNDEDYYWCFNRLIKPIIQEVERIKSSGKEI